MPGGILDGDLEAGVFKLLSSSPDILTFVPATRIASTQLPEGVAYPAISFFRVSEEHDTTLDDLADLNPSEGLCWALVQFDAWANTPREAALVVRAIRTSLEGYRGVVSGLDIHFNPWNLNITAINREDVRGPYYESASKTFHASVDMTVWYND